MHSKAIGKNCYNKYVFIFYYQVQKNYCLHFKILLKDARRKKSHPWNNFYIYIGYKTFNYSFQLKIDSQFINWLLQHIKL